MNSAMTSFRLIIVHESPQEAQRLSSMFQNAGKPCRTQHINAEANLKKILEEQSWDLIIAHDSEKTLPASAVIRSIRQSDHDTAVIIVSDEKNEKTLIDGLKIGACDVVQMDDDQHLLLVVARELENRNQRKTARITQRKLKELERRNQKLLDSSRDGIAFVQDGMYSYANSSFAETLGYNDKNDIEFMPIMDSIHEDNHKNVKNTLKNFSLQKNPEDNNHLRFNIILPNNKQKEICVELFTGEYDDEPCTQLVHYAKLEDQAVIEETLQNIKDNDDVTGLYNRSYLIEKIEKTVDEVAETEIHKSFIFIDIDRFSRKVKNTINITEIDKLIKMIANIIKTHYTSEKLIARVSDHSFAIISDEHEPEKLLEKAQSLCTLVSERLFEIGQKTLQLSLSIGICIINENTIDSQALIHSALHSIETLRKNQDGNGANIFQKDAEEGDILASNFKKALENDDFMLLFQPILSLRGEDVERYEVLLRMIIDEQEISPTQFLKIAKNLNLSTKVDRWVILQSFKYLSENIKASAKTQLFINLTTTSLCDDTLLPWIKVAINAAKIEPSSIVLQASEADIINHLTVVKQFADNAKAMGIQFSISNFSSVASDPMNTLDYVDAKYIKIDNSLSHDLQDNSEESQALKTLVDSLHAKKKVTIIPHIEKASILSTLWELGVHCIQGNYLQPPSNGMNYEFSSDE